MDLPKVKLNLPKVDWTKQPKPFVCRRAIKEGGFALFQKEFNDKFLIHSYGHGGAQFSLSFGNAYLVSKMLTMRQHPTDIHEVAVLGSGITGLLVSLQLLKTKYKVNLYADRFPKYNQPNLQNRLGSQQGLQFWYPSFYDIEDPVRHQFVCKIAYRLFKQCIEQKKYQSIKWVNCFISGPQIETVAQVVSEFITKDITKVNLDLGNGVAEQVLCFRTFLIDTQMFLEQIMIELKLRRVNLIPHKFTNVEDVANLKQKSIINCLGIGAKQVFADQKLNSMVGHYVQFDLDEPVEENFVIWKSSQDQNQDDVVITAAGKTVQFGSSWKKDTSEKIIDRQVVTRICSRAQQYMRIKSPELHKI